MTTPTLLRPFVQTQTLRSLAFLLAALPVGAVAFALLVAGLTTTLVLAITPLVVPALVAFRGAVGLLARADALLAERLLGVEVRPPIDSGGRWFWRRGIAVLADRSFWTQLAYFVLRTTAGFAVAIALIALLGAALQTITYPIWYRWSDAELGSWRVDSFAESLLLVPAGIVLLLATVLLLRPLGAAAGLLAKVLLDAGPGERPRPVSRAARRAALVVDAGVAVAVSGVLVLVWALSGGGSFWPAWAILPLVFVAALHGVVELVEERPALRAGPIVTHAFALHAGIWIVLLAFLIGIWALAGGGYFWPAWPALAAAILLALHAAANYVARGGRLARRVGVLEETRSAAVSDRDAELRRIERDLHDGAQARLVALGMNLGLAEQKLASDPEGAKRLVAEARVGVGEALAELRDLARGIHPPVLGDRGLGAALATLADRSALPVTLAVALDERLPPAVETAAYFVVAEALANAAKHSDASRIAVAVARRGDVLELRIEDDGRGGADPSGSGLTGLRRRVEALDGTLALTSPEGGPTVVHAELPCGS